MNDMLKDLLYRSFDSELSPREQQQLEQALAESPELRAEKHRLERIRQAAASSATESFKPFFVERVMRRIETLDTEDSRSEEFFRSLWGLFRPVAIIGAAAAVMLIGYNLQEAETISLSSAFAVPQQSQEVLIETPLESMLEDMS